MWEIGLWVPVVRGGRYSIGTFGKMDIVGMMRESRKAFWWTNAKVVKNEDHTL